jgi:hypothetical protein
MPQRLCTAADRLPPAVGAVLGPPSPRQKTAISLSSISNLCCSSFSLYILTMLCSCEKAITHSLSGAYVVPLPLRCPYLIEPPDNTYSILFYLFRSSSILPCCYDDSAEETKIPLVRQPRRKESKKKVGYSALK